MVLRKRAILNKLREWIGPLTFLILCLVTRTSIAGHYQIPTGSMLPAVQIDDRILVNKTAYCLRVPISGTCAIETGMPARGDVVVLDPPEDGDIPLLKRVVALPGETVEIANGRVLINGQQVRYETQTGEILETLGTNSHVISSAPGPDFGPVVVPTGELLVLGDNRGNSRDGRFFGFIPTKSLVGRATKVFLRHGSWIWDDL